MTNIKQTYTFPVQDHAWGQAWNDYQNSKKHLPWRYNIKPAVITERDKKANDLEYNPITQRYSNETVENEVSVNEKRKWKHSLSQSYDNVWRNEQTFNIVNLKDKLKGMEAHPDYPVYIQDHEKLRNSVHFNNNYTDRQYNIISNRDWIEHHNIPNESWSRQELMKPTATGQNGVIINSNIYKDYNIVTNKYYINNKRKQRVDKEAAVLRAAFWRNNSKDYDVINRRYYNESLDKNIDTFEKNREKKRTQNMCNKVQWYNPINWSAYDINKLALCDRAEFNKKLRYHFRPEIEDYYHRKSEDIENKKKEYFKQKVDYKRFQEIDKRGYDWLNMSNTYGKYQKNFDLRNNKDEWERLQNSKGDNETFTTKELFEDGINKHEQDEKEYQFKKQRITMWKKWLPVKEDPLFKRIANCKNRITSQFNNCATNRQNIDNNISLDSTTIPYSINKSEWFSKNRSVDMSERVYPIMKW